MTDHFTGQFEVELKFRVSSHQPLIQQLQARHAECFVEKNQETDYFYECKDSRLATAGISMSVRVMSPSGIQLWIVKGPAPDKCEAVNITSASTTRNMLETLGYTHQQTLEKTRSIYFLGDFHITLDTIAGLGDFAEIAVMTDDSQLLSSLRQQCLELAASFGLQTSQLVDRSYRDLLNN